MTVGPQTAAVGTAGVILLALVLQPLQFELVQLFEGYWPVWPAVKQLRRRRVDAHQRRRQSLEDDSNGVGLVDPAEMDEAFWRLRHAYPAHDRVLPTKLGNALRAAEDRAGDRYALDAVVTWPRLYLVLPGKMLQVVTDELNQLDLAVRICALLLLAVPLQGAVLVSQPVALALHPLWLAAPLLTALAVVLSYRSAMSAAVGYGLAIEVAFDLYRFDLLSALHLQLPATRSDELDSNRELSNFLRQAVDERGGSGIVFQHQRRRRAKAPAGAGSKVP
jgi:hypothetical protein